MNKDLTVGKPSTVLAGFCLPLFASVVFQQLYNIADSLVAGKLIGSDALASVGNSYEITLLFLAFAVGCNTGCSVMTAQLFGGKRYGELRTCVSTVFTAVAVLCGVLMTVGLTGGKSLLRLIHTPQPLLYDSWAYLKIYIYGLPFLFFYNVSTGIFTALGDSKTPFYFLLCSSASNVLMDIYFVSDRGLHMGVNGVAWATFLCQGVSCTLAVAVVIRRLNRLNERDKYPWFSFSILRRVSVVAIPSILQKSFISVGNVIIQGAINGFGADVIAGYAAGIKLNNLLGTSLFALGDGVANFTAQNLGAGQTGRIKQGFRAGIRISLLMIVPMAILFFVLAKPLSLLFLNHDDKAALQTSVSLLRILSPFYFCYVKAVSDGVLRGSGQMKRFMAGTFTDLLLRVLLALTLSRTALGSLGIWWSWPLGWLIAAVMSCWFYRHTRWETIRTL